MKFRDRLQPLNINWACRAAIILFAATAALSTCLYFFHNATIAIVAGVGGMLLVCVCAVIALTRHMIHQKNGLDKRLSSQNVEKFAMDQQLSQNQLYLYKVEGGQRQFATGNQNTHAWYAGMTNPMALHEQKLGNYFVAELPVKQGLYHQSNLSHSGSLLGVQRQTYGSVHSASNSTCDIGSVVEANSQCSLHGAAIGSEKPYCDSEQEDMAEQAHWCVYDNTMCPPDKEVTSEDRSSDEFHRPSASCSHFNAQSDVSEMQTEEESSINQSSRGVFKQLVQLNEKGKARAVNGFPAYDQFDDSRRDYDTEQLQDEEHFDSSKLQTTENDGETVEGSSRANHDSRIRPETQSSDNSTRIVRQFLNEQLPMLRSTSVDPSSTHRASQSTDKTERTNAARSQTSLQIRHSSTRAKLRRYLMPNSINQSAELAQQLSLNDNDVLLYHNPQFVGQSFVNDDILSVSGRSASETASRGGGNSGMSNQQNNQSNQKAMTFMQGRPNTVQGHRSTTDGTEHVGTLQPSTTRQKSLGRYSAASHSQRPQDFQVTQIENEGYTARRNSIGGSQTQGPTISRSNSAPKNRYFGHHPPHQFFKNQHNNSFSTSVGRVGSVARSNSLDRGVHVNPAISKSGSRSVSRQRQTFQPFNQFHSKQYNKYIQFNKQAFSGLGESNSEASSTVSSLHKRANRSRTPTGDSSLNWSATAHPNTYSQTPIEIVQQSQIQPKLVRDQLNPQNHGRNATSSGHVRHSAEMDEYSLPGVPLHHGQHNDRDLLASSLYPKYGHAAVERERERIVPIMNAHFNRMLSLNQTMLQDAQRTKHVQDVENAAAQQAQALYMHNRGACGHAPLDQVNIRNAAQLSPRGSMNSAGGVPHADSARMNAGEAHHWPRHFEHSKAIVPNGGAQYEQQHLQYTQQDGSGNHMSDMWLNPASAAEVSTNHGNRWQTPQQNYGHSQQANWQQTPSQPLRSQQPGPVLSLPLYHNNHPSQRRDKKRYQQPSYHGAIPERQHVPEQSTHLSNYGSYNQSWHQVQEFNRKQQQREQSLGGGLARGGPMPSAPQYNDDWRLASDPQSRLRQNQQYQVMHSGPIRSQFSQLSSKVLKDTQHQPPIRLSLSRGSNSKETEETGSQNTHSPTCSSISFQADNSFV